MFAIFLENVFYGFWGNTPGDIFIDNTIKNLRLDPSKVKLVHYEGVYSAPEFFEIDSANVLKIKSKNSATNPDTGEEVITYSVASTHDGVVYYENGLMVVTC